MKLIGQILFVLVAISAICMFSSCDNQKESIPDDLVEIDSALMKGECRKAEILLDEYEDQHYDNDEPEETMMFHKLMRAFVRYRKGEEFNDIKQMDSICNYYAKSDTEESILSLLIMADAYRHIQEYPTAMKYCLSEENKAVNMRKENLLCWIYRQKGIIYKVQQMYDDAQRCYRKHYALAEKLQDKRQMIMGAHDMGFVYTYKGDVDSTILYYKKSIELAKTRKDSSLYLAQTRAQLYDIYIQIEAYDSVKNVMPRDSMNYDNWAYYYKSIGNIDSAIYNFKQCVGNYSLNTDRRCLRELINIEKKCGNLKEVVALYEQLALTEDSIKRIGKEEETKRTQVRYDYEQIKQQHDELAKKKVRNDWIAAVSLSILILLIVIAYLFISNKWKDKKAELNHEKLLRQEEENKRKQSEKQLADNIMQQEQLKQQLEKVEHDLDIRKRLLTETDLLSAENRVIEARQKRHRLLLDEFHDSDLYRRIRQNVGNHNFRLSEEDWLQLSTYLDNVYDNLTKRILNIANLNPTELRIIYLLKLEVQPIDMAIILCKSKSAITMIRNRMYKKIFGKNGTTTALDEYIKNF